MKSGKHLNESAPLDSECTSLGLFSRRAFFKLTAVVGALTFVGTTHDGRIQAWADEKGELFFSIYILSNEEVPIMVFDVSKDKPTPLEGVKVTIVSQVDSDKTITVTTRDTGFAPANIRPLSWQADFDDVKTYNFHGSITAVKDGYTEFYVPDNFVEAGTPPSKSTGVRTNVIIICMEPLNGNPYLRQFSLDGEDILYFDGDTSEDEKDKSFDDANFTKGCAVWKDNTMVHDLVAEVVSIAPKATVEVSILVNNVAKATQTVTTGDSFPYKATAKFSDQWLNILEVGNTLGASLRENGGKTVTITSPLKFVKPILTSKNLGLQENFKVSPGVPNVGKEYKPFAGFLNRPGDTLTCQLPDFPLQIFADSSGRVGVSATLFEITLFRWSSGDKKAGNPPKKLEAHNIAERFTGKSIGDAWQGYKDKFSKGMEAVENSYFDYFDEKKEGLNKILRAFPARFSWSFSMDVIIDAMGFGYCYQYNNGTRGCADIGIKPQFSMSAAWTMQVLVLFIPLYVGLDGSLKLSSIISTGLEFGEGIEHATYVHKLKGKNWPNIYMCLNFNFELAANLGVGVQGLISAGARGGGYIRGEIDFHPRGELDCPHRVFKIGALVDVTIHLIFVKKTLVAHKFEPWVIFDNWNKKNSESDRVSEDLQNSVVSVFNEDPEPDEYITDDILAKTAETSATWTEQDYFPTYETISSLVDGPLPELWGENLYDDDDEPRAAVNGVCPKRQILLYKSCFSNPRIRIVHTDTKSFVNDRAFMLRVVVAKITPPKTTQLFASDEVWYNGKPVNADEKCLVIEDDGYGNRYVKPSASEAPANAPEEIYRTRIAVSEWNRKDCTWGPATMVDFYDLGEIREIDRLNSYDIDFDVELYDGHLLIAITSVQRPQGENPTYLEQESNQYLSLVRWDINEKKFTAAGSTFSLLNGGMSLFYPRILMQNFDEGDGKGATLHAVVYSYACTYNEKKTGYRQGFLAATVFDDMKPSTSTFGHRFSNPATIVPEVLDALDPNDLVHGVFEVACPNRELTVFDEQSQRNQTTAVFVWSHPTKTETYPFVRSFAFCETFSVVKKTSGAKTEYVSTVNQRSKTRLDKVPFVAKLGVCNQEGLFNFPDMAMPDNRKNLKTITFDQKTLQVAVMAGNVGETDKTQYFASFNGRRLYCVRSLHYDAPGYDEKTVDSYKSGDLAFFSDGPYNAPVKEPTTDVTQVRLYQLCEARWIEERQTYYDFYPIAQLKYVPDNIGVICAEKTYTSFTMATIDFKEDTADIYQVDVPVVLDWESRKAAPVAPFAAPGDLCYYTIEIRNVGNAPITAITLQASTNGTVFEKRTFDKLQNHVLTSPEDHKTKFKDTKVGTEEWEWDLATGVVDVDEEGNALGEVKQDEIPLAGILWPGRRRTFCFYFKVPTNMDLHGDTTFGVRVVEVEDRMDYKKKTENAYEWPEDLIVDPYESASGSDVPLLGDEDYLYNDDDNDAVLGSEDWVIPMLRKEDDEAWWDDEYEFGISLDDHVYYTLDDISYPQIEVDGVDVKAKTVAKTGDNTAVVAAGAAAAVATAGAVAVKAYQNAQEEDATE